MEKTKEYTSPYEMDGRIPWPKAIVYGLQHVLAMFVGNLTPLLIITGVISEKDALKSIDLKTIFLFGGTLSLAEALQET